MELGILMFTRKHTYVPYVWIKSRSPAMPNMHPDSNLTQLAEKVLLSLWKLNGLGRNRVKEESLKADLAANGTEQDLRAEIASLQILGLLESETSEGSNLLSLTALGLSILRQLEEDKLQELK
jgi:hypothetical protein